MKHGSILQGENILKSNLKTFSFTVKIMANSFLEQSLKTNQHGWQVVNNIRLKCLWLNLFCFKINKNEEAVKY